MFTAYKIDWVEYEPGWGCRPDGTSFHATKEEADAYIKKHWGRQANQSYGSYCRPGIPTLVEVDKRISDLLKARKIVWSGP